MNLHSPLSICTLEGNKITYNYDNEFNITDDEIIQTMIGSKILVIVDNCNYPQDFISKKYLRFFKDEKLNLEKTTYIIWNYYSNGYIINFNKICILLPETIKYIRLSNEYNGNLACLPSTITHIIFGHKYNNQADNLHFSIEYLFFGELFNKPIDNLPSCLKKLLFTQKSDFNQNLDNLPNFLEYLFLPTNYTKSLDNLPNFLTHLDLYCEYKHCLNNLPNSLEKIIFYSPNKIIYSPNGIINEYYVPPIKKIYDPKSTNCMDIKYIDKIFVKLPQNLKYLDLTHSYKLNLMSEFLLCELSDANTNVKKEKIKKNLPLDNLPKTLQILKFPANYNLIQIEKIPQNIEKLWLSNTFNSSIDRLLNCNFIVSTQKPQTKITHLIFGEEFNQSVNYLPNTLTHLYFGNKFNKSVDNLPNFLVFVSFGNNFNKTINNLPIGIIGIKFGYDFTQSINKLPFTIETIKFSNKLIDHELTTYSTKINKLPVNFKKIYLKNLETYIPIKNIKNKIFYLNFEEYEKFIEYY